MSYDEHLISMACGDGDPLDAIQRRVDKATPGPWFREYSDVVTPRPDPRDTEEGYEDPRDARVVRGAPHLPKKDRQGIADAEFIAHARTDVPALLALVREQQAEIRRYAAEDADAFMKLQVTASQAKLRATIHEQQARIERGNDALFDVLHKWRAGSHVSYSDIEEIRTALNATEPTP